MKAIIITVSDIQPVTDMVTYDTHRDDLKVDNILVANKMNLMIEELIKIVNSDNRIVSMDDLKDYLQLEVDKTDDEDTLLFEHPGLFLLYQILLATETHPDMRDVNNRLKSVKILDPYGDVIIHL